MLLLMMLSFVALAADEITINYAHQDKTLEVMHCFTSAPDYVEANDRVLQNASSNILWQGQKAAVHPGYIELPDQQAGCLSYTVDGDAVTSKQLKQQHPGELLLKIDAMLWQPDDMRVRDLPHVIFNHATHIHISSPWQLLSRSAQKTSYLKKPSPKYSDGYIAIGELQTERIILSDSQLRLAILAGAYRHRQSDISHWVKTMAESVAQVSGGFPLDDVQVLVVLIDGDGGAVPWGQVNRGGGQGVLLVVNANKGSTELMADWTAPHEFSHLLTPYTPYDRWLSEGFASYHQNISRLRTGLLDEKTAWSKLVAGFERGQRSAAKISAPVLKQSNRRHNMQMYWGGAVIALKADVALQRETNGQVTLSDALAGLQTCCLGQGRGWSARALFSQLDAITNTQVFTELYQQEVLRKPYPEFHSVLDELGIKTSPYGEVELNDKAPLSMVRKRIANAEAG
ncbi:hypothetical protein [Marinicella marina]|nr:hypothetical protein [Marinicella marina]